MNLRALSIVLICATGACHHVVLDPVPPVPTDPMPFSARYEVEPLSATYAYSMRSFAAGIANKWTVHVGEALVSYSQAYLGESLHPGDDLSILLSIEHFEIDDFRARASVRFVVKQGDVTRLDRVYVGIGESHFKRTAMTGVFGMQGSMKKTTDEALRSVFAQFVPDVRAQMNSWGGSTGQ